MAIKPNNKGGRPKGSKNRRTLEMERIASRELEARLEAAAKAVHASKAAGHKDARDILDELMHYGMQLVAYSQRGPGPTPRSEYHEENFRWAAEFTSKCAIALAEYQHPKLSRVAVGIQSMPAMGQVIDAVPNKAIPQIGDPARVYEQMIRKVA